MKNTISKMIDTTSKEAQYDACVKRLLSEKIILAWILKECVSETRFVKGIFIQKIRYLLLSRIEIWSVLARLSTASYTFS